MQALALAVRNLRRRRWHLVVSGTVLTIATLVLIVSLGFGNGVLDRLRYVKDSGLDRAGVMTLWVDPAVSQDELSRALLELTTELRAQPGVAGIPQKASIAIGITSSPSSGPPLLLHGSAINADFVYALTPRISAGRWFTTQDWATGQEVTPVVLNERWQKRFSIGSRLSGSAFGAVEPSLKLEVIGFLPENTYVLDSPSNNLEDVLPTFDTDILVPALDDTKPVPFAPSSLLVVANSEGALLQHQAEWSALAAKIFDSHHLAPLAGSEFQIWTMREMADQHLKRMKEPLTNALWLTGLVLLLTIFGFGSMNALSAWDRRQEWGIHLACGATKADLVATALGELLFPLVAPVLTGLLVWVGVAILGDPAGMRINGSVIAVALTAAVASSVLSGIGPVLFLRSVSAVRLVRGTGVD